MDGRRAVASGGDRLDRPGSAKSVRHPRPRGGPGPSLAEQQVQRVCDRRGNHHRYHDHDRNPSPPGRAADRLEGVVGPVPPAVVIERRARPLGGIGHGLKMTAHDPDDTEGWFRRPLFEASLRPKVSMGKLRIVRAEGDPHARGQQVGRELRDLVNESVDFYHRYLSRRGVSSEQLQELLTPYLVASETHFPIYTQILKGMSVGAMVPVLELFAINAFEELEPLLEAPEGGLLFLQRKEGYVSPPVPKTERCTSFAVATS